MKLTARLNRDHLIGAGLAVIVMASRLPFVGTILYHWDSINFAFGLQHFDVANSQPQIPGYILYVFFARLVNVAVGDAQSTLAGISVVSSGLAVGCLYGLALTMFGRAVAVLAAALLASSPLFWFYGEVALPHSLDALVVILAVWLLYRIRLGSFGLLVPAALWLGIAGGLRQQTQVFLMPLACYVGWRVGWRRCLLPLAALVMIDLAWFVPLVWSTGGLFRYLAVMHAFYLTYNTTTSVFSGGGLWGVHRNALKLGMYTLYAWSLGVVPVALAVTQGGLRGRAWLRDERCVFILLWVVPTLAYYLFVHMGQQGLVFVFLPALCLVSAAALYTLAWTGRWRRQAMLGLLITANSAIFLFAPTYPTGGDRLKLLTVQTLRQHDASYRARLEAVRQRFPAQHTLLISSAWRFPQFYLPAYPLVRYGITAKWELGEGQPTRQDEAWIDAADMAVSPDATGFVYVVVFDDPLVTLNASATRLEWLPLSTGERLAYMRLTPQERLRVGPQSYDIVAAAPVPR